MSETLTGDLWATATGDEEGRPLIFRFRQHLPAGVRSEDFPTLVNIHWRFDGTTSNGMPPKEDNDRQITLEDTIAPLDEKEGLGYLMLVVTGNSRKEWIHYVKNVDRWLARLNELLVGHDEYPIEIATEEDMTWKTWRSVASCAQH